MTTKILNIRVLSLPLVIVLMIFTGCTRPMPGMDPNLGSGPEVTDGGVLFTYFDTKASRVNIVGDFNNWSMTADPMYDREGNGWWSLRLPLKSGRYQYKFLVDGSNWIPDPANAETSDDGFGGLNSIVIVE
jgi:1,4-alpha-glucan branching enzyme